METINTVITAVSIIICLVLIAYFIRWSAWKRVKPAYVRRNVMNFSWIQAVFLIAALLVNGIVMDIRGESGDYYAAYSDNCFGSFGHYVSGSAAEKLSGKGG